jgi:hypothetical protein
MTTEPELGDFVVYNPPSDNLPLVEERRRGIVVGESDPDGGDRVMWVAWLNTGSYQSYAKPDVEFDYGCDLLVVDPPCDHVDTGRVRKYDSGRRPELCRKCYTVVGTWAS